MHKGENLKGLENHLQLEMIDLIFQEFSRQTIPKDRRKIVGEKNTEKKKGRIDNDCKRSNRININTKQQSRRKTRKREAN